MRKFSAILSVIAVVLSVFAIYVSVIHPKPDATSNLIATLGVLCTVLIGWQILSFINLSQYEKRLKRLEDGIGEAQKNLDIAMERAYTSMYRTTNVVASQFANVYRHLWHSSHNTKEMWLHQEILHLLTELEGCLYTQDLTELDQTKARITSALKADVVLPDILKKGLRDQWKGAMERFESSRIQKPDSILIEIEHVTQLLDLLLSEPKSQEQSDRDND